MYKSQTQLLYMITVK